MGISGAPLQYVIVDRQYNTTPIYLINREIRVRLRVALLAFFAENNENEHLVILEFHGR